MPVTMELRENGRVLYYTISEPWTLKELMDRYPEEQAYRDSVAHTVHELVNLSRIGKIPPNALAARHIPAFSHSKSGFFVIVSSNILVQRLAQTIFQLARSRQLRFFESEDKGWEFIRQALADEDATKA